AELATKRHLPIVGVLPDYAEAGWLMKLRAEPHRSIPAHRGFRGPGSQRSQARRPTRRASHADPSRDLPKDRDGDRAHDPTSSRAAITSERRVMTDGRPTSRSSGPEARVPRPPAAGRGAGQTKRGPRQ